MSYGPHPSQNAEVHLPRGGGPHPAVVLLHGGLWNSRVDRGTMRRLAHHLAGHGFAVLNLEYRRLGEAGGGWPGTLLDAVRGAELAGAVPRDGQGNRLLAGIDTDRVALVGHCSGGQLALWAAAWLCSRIGPEAAASRPTIRAVVGLGAITDLRETVREALEPASPSRRTAAGLDRPASREGGMAVLELLGGSAAAADGRFRLGSPIELLPLGCQPAQLLVHGGEDDVVSENQARRYVRRAAQWGDRASVALCPGADHWDLLDPDREACALMLEHLREHLSG